MVLTRKMNQKEIDELRDEVCHLLLSKMSKGSQFQFALDRMHQIYSHYSEEELKQMLKQHSKPEKKQRKKGGGGIK